MSVYVLIGVFGHWSCKNWTKNWTNWQKNEIPTEDV